MGTGQVIKLSKKQRANNIAISLLQNLSSHANSIKRVLDKGVDDQGTNLNVTPDLIKKALSPEQLGAIEEFVGNFYDDPPEPPKPPLTDVPARSRRRR